MMVKSTLLAVLLSLIIFGSLDVVQAQTFTNGGVDPAHLVGLGWNYGHLSNCADCLRWFNNMVYGNFTRKPKWIFLYK
jgi:hypothetical protein